MADGFVKVEAALYRAKALRVQQSFDKAEALLRQAEVQLRGDERPKAARLLSRLYYELGYLLMIVGKYQDGADTMKQSGAAAAVVGDDLRVWYAELMRIRVLFLGDLISAKTAHARNIELERSLRAIPSSDPNDAGRSELWVNAELNLYTELSQTSFETNDAGFPEWSRQTRTHPRIVSNLRTGIVPYDLLEMRCLAREEMHAGAYEQSCQIFLNILELNMEAIASGSLRPTSLQSPVSEFFYTSAEEPARDYRDLARSIIRMNGDDAKAKAIRLLDHGAQLVSGNANQRYLTDMQRDLKLIGESQQ